MFVGSDFERYDVGSVDAALGYSNRPAWMPDQKADVGSGSETDGSGLFVYWRRLPLRAYREAASAGLLERLTVDEDQSMGLASPSERMGAYATWSMSLVCIMYPV